MAMNAVLASQLLIETEVVAPLLPARVSYAHHLFPLLFGQHAPAACVQQIMFLCVKKPRRELSLLLCNPDVFSAVSSCTRSKIMLVMVWLVRFCMPLLQRLIVL